MLNRNISQMPYSRSGHVDITKAYAQSRRQERQGYSDLVKKHNAVGDGRGFSNNLLNVDPATACAPMQYNSGRWIWGGFDRVCIPGCECVTVVAKICAQFTFANLYIKPSSAADTVITGLTVCMQSLLGNCNPIPSDLFTCCEFNETQWGGLVVEANSEICMEIENLSKHPVEFIAAVGGFACVMC